MLNPHPKLESFAPVYLHTVPQKGFATLREALQVTLPFLYDKITHHMEATNVVTRKGQVKTAMVKTLLIL